MTNLVARYEGAEVAAEVAKLRNGRYSVSVLDIESGEYLPFATIFPGLDQARAEAKAIAAGNRGCQACGAADGKPHHDRTVPSHPPQRVEWSPVDRALLCTACRNGADELRRLRPDFRITVNDRVRP